MEAYYIDLSTALRVFTKCFSDSSSFEKAGYFCLSFLDDWLLKAAVREALLSHIAYITTFFFRPGATYECKKSRLCPTQRILFIGSVLDFLPEDRFFKIVQNVLNIQIHHS